MGGCTDPQDCKNKQNKKRKWLEDKLVKRVVTRSEMVTVYQLGGHIILF